MKKKFSSLIIILLATVSIVAQDYAESAKSLDLHINPVTVIDYTPRVRLGIEFTARKPFGYVVDFGIGTRGLAEIMPASGTFKNAYSLYEIRSEFKYYFPGNMDYFRVYSSLEFFGLIMHSVLKNSYYYTEGSTVTVDYDRADLEKIKYGAHLKTGLRIKRSERMSIDLYAGIGIAQREFSYNNIVNPSVSQYFRWEEWIPQNYKYEGSRTVLHFTAGIKIGIILFQGATRELQ